MNSYEIVPYVGVGQLKLGITAQEAEVILGKPKFSDYDEDTGLVTKYWNDNGIQLSFEKENDRLVLISLYSNINDIKIESIDLDWKKTKEIYRTLVRNDPSARQTVGITVFFKYGFSVTGFLGESNGDKSLTVFAEGQWKQDDPFLKPLVARD